MPSRLPTLTLLALASLAGAAACGHSGAAAPKTDSTASSSGLKPTGLVRVFKGPEGQSVAVVFLDPVDKGQVLVKFAGTGTAWDGKVFLQQVRPAGRGEDFVAQVGGSEYVTMVSRDHSYEIYPPGHHDGIGVGYSEGDSKATDAAQVLRDYEAQPAAAK
jgi:hypothetical protein